MDRDNRLSLLGLLVGTREERRARKQRRRDIKAYYRSKAVGNSARWKRGK